MSNLKSILLVILFINLLSFSAKSQCNNESCDSSNTFMGVGSGNNNTGVNNSFFGSFAGNSNTTGSANALFGPFAGNNITTGSVNICIGAYAGYDITTGTANTMIGVDAGNSTTGSYNTFIGEAAGINFSGGSRNICIGIDSGPTGFVNQSDRLYIDVEESNAPLIYGEFNNDFIEINGDLEVADNLGVGVPNPAAKVHINAAASQIPLRAELAGQLKFHVSTNGGASIGTPSAPPGNGLAVSGNTGIGTTSPGQKLEVVGAIKIGTTSTNSNGSIRYNGNDFQGYTNGSWVNLNNNASSVWGTSGSNAFYNNGNVGIGTSNPTSKLHVTGDVAVSGSIIAPSDMRLKENIQHLENATHIVKQLQVYSYKYDKAISKELGLSTDKQYGLMAQEVKSLLPEIIKEDILEDKNGESYMGIEYTQLLPIVIQSLKELNAEKERLESRLDEQKRLIRKLIEER